jgi:hypothetical protein
MNQGYRLLILTACCTGFFAACGDETSPQEEAAITAPTPQSPSNGTTVQSSTPTLVVNNASAARGPLTYRFEVALDSGFANRVAEASGIAEGSGTTSWQVTTPLGQGQHFWRARATAAGVDGPYSAAAGFTVEAGFITTSAQNNLFVFDPLTNGGTVGMANGGDFTSRGWFCTAADKFIRYDIPPTRQGFVEFQVTNLMELNPVSDKRQLFIMWDPSRGDYTTNAFRVNIMKLDRRTVNFNHVRLRWIANGEQRDTGYDFTAWSPQRVYTWRIEWGSFPDLTNSQRVRVMVDGEVVMERNYDRAYLPSTHWVELGGAPRNESLEQAVYSNVRIGRR